MKNTMGYGMSNASCQDIHHPAFGVIQIYVFDVLQVAMYESIAEYAACGESGCLGFTRVEGYIPANKSQGSKGGIIR